MNTLKFARFASIVGLAGAAVQIIYGLLAVGFPIYETGYEWAEVLWAVANVGIIGCALGLLALNIARPRSLALIGTVVSVLGSVIRIVASAMIVGGAGDDMVLPYVLSSIGLMVLGMGALGVATLLGKQVHGWRAWTPLVAVVCALVIVPTYSINLNLHFILLGLWGIAWILVAAMVFGRTSSDDVGAARVSSAITP